MLNGDRNGMRIALSLFTSFSAFEKTKVLSIILRLMSKRLMSTTDSNQERLIRGMAYALEQLTQNDTVLQNYLVDWLTSGVSGVAGAELGVRRAVLTVVFSAKSSMDSDSVMDGRKTGSNHGEQVLKQLLDQFGDKLFIQHAPVLNQEGARSFPFSVESNSFSVHPGSSHCCRLDAQNQQTFYTRAIKVQPLSECGLKSLSCYFG